MIIRSDVPVGVALSGGLDSSAIAALAARKYPGTMHAFSVGYPGRPPSDERADAQALADHLKMPFHEVELDTTGMAATFPELVWWRDDPIADISGHGYFAVMKLAGEHGVPVMLQGQGGDELFWGVRLGAPGRRGIKAKAALVEKGWRALPEYLSFEAPGWLGPRTLLKWAADGFGLGGGWERFQRDRRTSKERMVFLRSGARFWPGRKRRACVLLPGICRPLEQRPRDRSVHLSPALAAGGNSADPFDLRYLPAGKRHRAGRRLSMASSVELRLPLVDYRLVETVIGLRKTQPDDHLPPKAWLETPCAAFFLNGCSPGPREAFPPLRQWHEALFRAHGAQLRDGWLVTAGVLVPGGSRELAAGPVPGWCGCASVFQSAGAGTVVPANERTEWPSCRQSDMTPSPRITFGMIVLNGEPFVRYNLRALYPFAHQIIVVEGAAPAAAGIATPEGHSIDGTLAALKQFKEA